jgi:hypothetical protein
MERPSARAALVGLIAEEAAVEAEVRKDAVARAGREDSRVYGGIVISKDSGGGRREQKTRNCLTSG